MFHITQFDMFERKLINNLSFNNFKLHAHPDKISTNFRSEELGYLLVWISNLSARKFSTTQFR